MFFFWRGGDSPTLEYRTALELYKYTLQKAGLKQGFSRKPEMVGNALARFIIYIPYHE